ncbi:hypothetical protein CON09_15920 [Bacillus anthracis]|nr:hypothetical protein CON09_15920 [Bacillus anthracis]
MNNRYESIQFGVMGYNIPNKEVVFGQTTLGQLLPIPYRDTEAGSNPREYQGLTEVNKRILESFLLHGKKNDFWAYHSGASLTITKGEINPKKENTLEFADACITNGLQTISLGRILIIIKTYQIEREKGEKVIHKKIAKKNEFSLREKLLKYFIEDVVDMIFVNVSINDVNNVLTWINKKENINFERCLNEMSLDDLLNIKIPFKAVLLDDLVSEDDTQRLGYDIANSNNDTQKVKVDDKFGTRYKEWLENELLYQVSKEEILIEYRRFSMKKKKDNQEVIHIIDLLRAILPTTLFVDKDDEDIRKFIGKRANKVEPVYNLFEKIIFLHANIPEVKNAIKIVANLMPDLIRMIKVVRKYDEKFRQNLDFDKIDRWADLKNCESYKSHFFDSLGNRKSEIEVNDAIKKHFRLSFKNLLSLFIYATRLVIQVDEKLNVSYDLDEDVIEDIIDRIYRTFVMARSQRSMIGSTSDLLRDSHLYKLIETDVEQIIEKKYNLHDYVKQFRVAVVTLINDINEKKLLIDDKKSVIKIEKFPA